MAHGKFVAYYRVSTQRQGRSGLGLDAQRTAVEGHLNGGRWTLAAEFVEVESGRKTDKGRPELAKALAAARLHGATLIVAKLDRLTRNAAFWFALREARVRVVCVDLPDAGDLVVGVMALVAEFEAKMISQRTRDALAQAKLRGVKLGAPHHLDARARRKGNRASAVVRSDQANQWAQDVASFLAPLRSRGASLREMVRELEAQNIPTARGGTWTPTAVRRTIIRVGAATPA